MTARRKILVFLLGLLLAVGTSTLPPVNASALPLAPFLPVTPAPSNEEEEGSSSPAEIVAVLDIGQHARRSVERPNGPDRQPLLHPPRRHHAPAVRSQPPSSFRATVNPPLHC